MPSLHVRFGHLVLATCMAGSLVAHAQNSPADSRYEFGEGIVKRDYPLYPRPFIRAGITGQVTIEVNVDKFGRPQSHKIQSSEPAGKFDEQAVSAIYGMAIRPIDYARCNRTFPKARVRFDFLLDDRGPLIRIAQLRGSEVLKVGESPPQLVSEFSELSLVAEPKPAFPQTNFDGNVDVILTTAADGNIRNVEIVFAAPDRRFEKAVLDAASTWRVERNEKKVDLDGRTFCVPVAFRRDSKTK